MLHTFVVWIVAHRVAIMALVGGSASLSVIGQTILHKLKVKLNIDSKAFSYTLVQLLVAAASVSAYLYNNNNLLHTWPLLATIVGVIHRYAVSPYYENKVLPYLEYEAGLKTQAAAMQAAQTTQSTAPAGASPSFT